MAWAAFGAVNGMLVGSIIARLLDRPLPPMQEMTLGAIAGGVLGGVGRLIGARRERR